MIEMNGFKIYFNDEMTNEEYHAETEHISGSSLAEMFKTSFAAWKFGEKMEAKPLAFGTAAHTNILEGERFTTDYMRGTDLTQVKDLITSQTGLTAKLKELGIVGTSGKKWDELLRIYADCGEELNIKYLIEWIDEAVAAQTGKILVTAQQYDDCLTMRSVLMSTPEYEHLINNGVKEMSIFGEIHGVKVKVRLDCVTDLQSSVAIDDYKTTANANPRDFSRSAHDLGYFMKMALQRDVFVAAFGEERPVTVRLLAQEKKLPYLAHGFVMSDEVLRIGRMDYMSVLQKYKACKESDVWPGYLNGQPFSDLLVMPWVAKQYETAK